MKVGVKNVDCQVEIGWINIQNLIKSKAREKGDVSVIHIRRAPGKKAAYWWKSWWINCLKKGQMLIRSIGFVAVLQWGKKWYSLFGFIVHGGHFFGKTDIAIIWSQLSFRHTLSSYMLCLFAAAKTVHLTIKACLFTIKSVWRAV